MSNYESMSDSESSDDEEYLVSSTNEDREAIIRRKLLESFYGTSDAKHATTEDQDEDQDEKDPKSSTVDPKSSNVNAAAHRTTSGHARKKPPSHNDTNLDSKNFNAPLFTTNLIQNSSTQTLLSSTNDLSQSVRILDSTMQTLVYENYSKFISATDAIRSIGQSVDVSNEGLDNLHQRMTSMEENTKQLEDQLYEKRRQVVEKLKLKRLLNRLTRLVELPHTLRKLAQECKYRFLMRDYLDAMNILTQHTGFESLKNIEGECHLIVADMVKEVGLKMWIWCGGNMGGGGRIGGSMTRRRTMARRRNTSVGKSGVLDRFWLSGGKLMAGEKDMDMDMDILPPKSVQEIYEGAGALLLYAQNIQQTQLKQKGANAHDDGSHLQSGGEEDGVGDSNSSRTILAQLTEEECRAMAFESCARYLEGLLEDHMIEVQEYHDNNALNTSTSSSEIAAKISLYPSTFLDSLLQAATLCGVTFRSKSIHGNAIVEDNKHYNSANDAQLLTEYVTMWFTSFLGHVKIVLHQHAFEQSEIGSESSGNNDEMQEEDDDELFATVSHELMKLVRSVREVASGLALPEVGLDMEIASSLVEEAMGITESMVRRRVMQKFRLLRVRMVKDCLSPFVKSVLEDVSEADEVAIIRTVQSANIALSDGMQFVDDTIRSILSNGADGTTKMGASSLDLGMVKLAVRKNAQKFACWLAASLEMIAGCETADSRITLDVRPMPKSDDGEESKVNKQVVEAAMMDYEQDYEGGEENEACSIEQILINELYEFIQDKSSDASNDVLCLALVEMSRLAERNILSNINQSISSSMEETKAKNDFFKSAKQSQNGIDSDELVSIRYQLAASRSLSLFVITKGQEASSLVCFEIYESSSIQSEFFPHGPSDASLKILEVAKNVCMGCAAAFGGNAMASPLPDFNDYVQDLSFTGSSRMAAGGHNAIKGLSLDVARMFTQKVQVYSHPLDIAQFTRDGVVTSMFRVALKAWIEQIRHCTFTTSAYRQLQVDIEFLKFLMPHYVGQDSVESLQTLSNDVVLNAGERCENTACVGVEEYYDEAMGKVLTPLSIAMGWLKEEDAAGGRGALDQFVMREELQSDE